MTKDPPPLLGFNNNVRHRGRVFHIQTEDSGVKHPRIVTHLFADGGRIVKTTRTDYAEHVGQKDMMPLVRRMMKEQHKAMFIALRAGELDEVLESVCGPLSAETRESRPSSETLAAVAPPTEASSDAPSQTAFSPSSGSLRAAELTAAQPVSGAFPVSEQHAVQVSGAAPEVVERDVRVSEIGRAAERVLMPTPTARRPPPPPKRSRTPGAGTAGEAGRYAPSRPAAIFGQMPSAEQHSIFGDSVISEKSLDEVILSYLAEDLEGTSQK